MTHWSRESHSQPSWKSFSVVCTKLHCFAPVCTNFFTPHAKQWTAKRDGKGRFKRRVTLSNTFSLTPLLQALHHSASETLDIGLWTLNSETERRNVNLVNHVNLDVNLPIVQKPQCLCGLLTMLTFRCPFSGGAGGKPSSLPP